MGHFNENFCDCCVCPMQCVLEQLVDKDINLLISSFPEADLDGTLISVNKFISTIQDSNGDIFRLTVSDICAAGIEEEFNFKLNPIRKSKGECSCIEDPITKLAQSMIGESTSVVLCNSLLTGKIINVGDGIVVMSVVDMGTLNTFVFSSCKIGGFGPPEMTNFNSKGKFHQFKTS
ncbi:hypothetical protein [Chengkuizengella marina]|uniref:Uncharacterized protein n=1 Tax=Chengkuizengella marina TaxID=2507566 RepID=A0A6N9Q8L7_9BACL|nr:hypothetical protein [Chengkuizengella marina]NBI31218.1 hypothetical protein [Chengkuizengella marina]